METGMKIDMTLALVIVSEPDAMYSYSPALKLYGKGDTAEQSIASFKEHLDKYIKFHQKNNSLLIWLSKLGWKKDQFMRMPEKMDIPTHLLNNKNKSFFDIKAPKSLTAVC